MAQLPCNCMATADREVMVFVKNCNGIRDPTTPKKFNSPLPKCLPALNKKAVKNYIKTQLFPIVLECQQCNKKSYIEPCAKNCQSVPKLYTEALLKSIFFYIPDLIHRHTPAAVACENRC